MWPIQSRFQTKTWQVYKLKTHSVNQSKTYYVHEQPVEFDYRECLPKMLEDTKICFIEKKTFYGEE